jgi:hypothetical protein
MNTFGACRTVDTNARAVGVMYPSNSEPLHRVPLPNILTLVACQNENSLNLVMESG